jgi:hypothetical protein
MTDDPKPPVGDMPTDLELEAMGLPGQEDVAEAEFLNPDDAAEDDTVDDQEQDGDA